MKPDGKIIVLEGLDYSGKTSQVQELVDYLKKKEFKVVTFREPGGTVVGEKIRTILKNDDMDPLTELLLFTSARMELITKQIQPLLKQGYVIVLDRFIDSTYAYQGSGRGLLHSVLYLERLITEMVKPDVVFYLDVDLKVAAQRASERGPADRLDSLSQDIKMKIKQGYTERMIQHPERTIRIDANLSIPEVTYQIKSWLDGHFVPMNKRLQTANEV